MTNDLHNFPFHCPNCRATGELPLVAGNANCPECGEPLWTVRAKTPAAGHTGLVPDDRLPLLPARPPLCTKGLWRVRLCVVLFRPIVILWIMLRQRTMESRVNAKLDKVGNCRQRGELEQLLGKPAYVVSGEAAGAANPPDLIECYESEGCCIDLWFKNDRLVDTSGFVKPTLWDMVLTRNAPPAS